MKSLCSAFTYKRKQWLAALLAAWMLAGCTIGRSATPSPTRAPAVSPIPTAVSPTHSPTPSRTPVASATPAKVEAGAPGSGDAFYPGMGNGGYDVQHYTIDLAVDMPTNTISATTSIEALATQDLGAFNLDLSGLEITRIDVDGRPAMFAHSGTELTIRPAGVISSGTPFTATVAYHGQPAPVDDPGVPFVGIGWIQSPDHQVVFVASEPSGAMSWFPSNNTPNDKATYTIRTTVAKPFVVASNGMLESTIDNGDTTTTIWQMRDLMASYLATVAIGRFERVDGAGPNGLALRHYFPAGTREQFAPAVADTGDMIAFYSDLIGPYPFEAYGGVVIPLDLGFALETQTMTIFGETSLQEAEVAHELAHQWFGDDVSPAKWQDVWLNEGFASYCQWMWYEHTSGRDRFAALIDQQYQLLAERQIGPPAAVPQGDMFGAAVYLRGAMALHALRLEVGDETFRAIVQEYYQRFKGRSASTSDFIAVANQVANRDLTSFLRAWLLERALPPLPAGTP